MLPIVLVLFFATSALAAPSAILNGVAMQDTSRPYDTGYGLNKGLVSGCFELIDQATLGFYSITMQNIIQDMANIRNSDIQALAASQTIAMLGTLSYGVPGNSCAAANAISQYVRNGSGQSSLATFVSYIDALVALARNPASLRFASGPSGNCNGGGRNYPFEPAWNVILEKTTPHTVAMVNEEYCAAKRLNQAHDVVSNNVGAATTAASLPPVVAAVKRNIELVLNFLRQLSNGKGITCAEQLKRALRV